MRRTCERPGCVEPAAVVYGYGEAETLEIWIDAWSISTDEQSWPRGAHGLVCERHGSLLSAPRGWSLVDRRESIPRLFIPRLVAPHQAVARSTTDSVNAPGSDTGATRRRQRLANLPAPQLFAELRTETIDSEPREQSQVPVHDDHEKSDSSTGDPLLSLLNPSSPLLQRAFGKRNTGPRDASQELMRPTTRDVVDESA